jgi:hypothetical protein
LCLLIFVPFNFAISMPWIFVPFNFAFSMPSEFCEIKKSVKS